MPIYEYKCQCGMKFDKWLSLADYDKPQRCQCGLEATKQLSASYIQPDMQPFLSPIDGKIINSNSDRRRHMKEHGVIEVGNEKLTRPYKKDYKSKGVAQDIVSSINELS